MRLYLDASALVKLVIREDDSERAEDLLDGPVELVTVSITEVEVRAAIARRLRGRVESAARRELGSRWAAIDVITLDERLVRAAGKTAETLRLRALDAIHLAAARRVAETKFALVTWDVELADAARRVGLAVAPG